MFFMDYIWAEDALPVASSRSGVYIPLPVSELLFKVSNIHSKFCLFQYDCKRNIDDIF